ncbi:hypothetical protein AMS68_006403 [Peltaster fructicola]|uniref:Signal recognition particle subunit SRP68 n=1 Tax=Peltaster fructicola TaxID=286661 RepID=A0A6H0Y1R6_9PEZI|nr:hypothetical protein AMS68_006403 [Peltaster fructicola]
MDITNYIQSHRSTLAISDQGTYHAYLTRRILALRRKLGIATSKSQKFTPHDITPDNVTKDRGYLELLLLQAERCWARAMHIKSLRGEGEGGLKGKSRSEVVSKCAKAAKIADHVVQLVKGSTYDQTALEAEAYKSMLEGSALFERLASGKTRAERQEWERCLKQWSKARIIYAAIVEKTSNEATRELLSGTVDPTIRYVAYQAGVARTVGTTESARKYFPKDDEALVKAIEEVDHYAFTGRPRQYGEKTSKAEAPSVVTWRGRSANIVDASIGQAIGAVNAAEAKLKDVLVSQSTSSSRDQAAAYDDILIASQDAADAAKRATDELEKEKVDEGNSRMQDLRVTSLSVEYTLISWRVGRNRVLIGHDDGLTFVSLTQKGAVRTNKSGKEVPQKTETTGRRLTRLRERIVLYDAIIQSIESVKDLRGAVRDETFVEELDAKTNYFRALKCVNIAYSHQLIGEHINALALLDRANTLLSSSSAASSQAKEDAPISLEITASTFTNAQETVAGLLSRKHALVSLHQFERNSAIAAEKHLTSAAPWVQRLHEYPAPGTQVDVKNLVNYPPKLEPVPVKPILLDVAWGYIDYPGRKAVVEERPAAVNGTAPAQAATESAAQEKKRGWFGFGR